jgi:hypothetical protein
LFSFPCARVLYSFDFPEDNKNWVEKPSSDQLLDCQDEGDVHFCPYTRGSDRWSKRKRSHRAALFHPYSVGLHGV